MALVTFGAGCFWHVQATFEGLKEVRTTVGYMGGTTRQPTYKEVCSDTTGHAEACQVEYDEKKVSFKELLKVFWRCHDSTQLNRQGPDVGRQYRSVIFYHSDEQRREAELSKQEEQKKRSGRVVTEIVPAGIFYPAEEYHQDYFKKHGKACLV